MEDTKRPQTAFIRPVRFNAKQYAAVEARAKELEMPIGTFIRLAAIGASGSALAKRELSKMQTLLRPIEE